MTTNTPAADFPLPRRRAFSTEPMDASEVREALRFISTRGGAATAEIKRQGRLRRWQTPPTPRTDGTPFPPQGGAS